MFSLGYARANCHVPKAMPLKPLPEHNMPVSRRETRIEGEQELNMKKAPEKRVYTGFRLTVESRAILFKRAEDSGRSAREWLDEAIISNKSKIIARKKAHPDLKPLLFHVNKAGNNINQIAHHLNTLRREHVIEHTEFKVAMRQLQEIQDALLEALNRAALA